MNTEEEFHYQRDTLRIFIKEELEYLKRRLNALKGRIEEEDFKSLENELNEKCEELEFIQEDDTRLFILRREVGFLKENLESAAIQKSWYSKVPITVWFQFILLPAVVYMLIVSLFQKQTQDIIQAYATQTAIVTQTVYPTTSQTVTITSTPIK